MAKMMVQERTRVTDDVRMCYEYDLIILILCFVRMVDI